MTNQPGNEQILTNKELETSEGEIPSDHAPVDELLNDIEHMPEDNAETKNQDNSDFESDLLLEDIELDDIDIDNVSEKTESEYDDKEQSATENADNLDDAVSSEEKNTQAVEDELEEDELEEDDQPLTLKDKIIENQRAIIVIVGTILVLVPLLWVLVSNLAGLFIRPTVDQPQQADYLKEKINIEKTQPEQVSQVQVLKPNIPNVQKQSQPTLQQAPQPAPQANQMKGQLASQAQEIAQLKAIIGNINTQPKQASAVNVSDSAMIDKNTDTILKVAQKTKQLESYIVQEIKSTLDNVSASVGLISNRLDEQDRSIKVIADSVIKLKQEITVGNKQIVYNKPKVRQFSQPSYELITALPGRAYIKSRKRETLNVPVSIQVGDHLIGYGRITGINSYGEITTISGRVKIK